MPFHNRFYKFYVILLQQWGSIDTNGNGGNPQVDDFLEQLEKFINNLMAALSNMEGQITLEENGVGHIIDTMESPADYQAVGRCFIMLESNLSDSRAKCKFVRHKLIRNS